MGQQETKAKVQAKTPISHETILKIMLGVTIGVASIFFIKNLIGKEMQAAVVIGAALVVFVAILYVMKVRNVAMETKELVVSVAILFLIFSISLFSGASYSDDFPLFLAAIGMAGLYFEPKITRTQIGAVAIFLIIMYVAHPEKSGGLSQYILCYVVTILSAILFYLTIKRGRAFIEISDDRAMEAEKLLDSIRNMGVELENDFESSSVRIDSSTRNLQRGSASITQGANEVSDGCVNVHDKIQETKQQINQLNSGVKKFETTLSENQHNVEAMGNQISIVGDIMTEANDVFKDMEQRMNEIAKIADQLGTISFNITLLSLNASIEAARGGNSGSGFAVVASEMRNLAVNSDKFSDRVSEVVKMLLGQVEKTSKQFGESANALDSSKEVMDELSAGFDKLKEQFASLYNNIEQQSRSVSQVDYIFEALDEKVSEMSGYSVENQNAVKAIMEAMDIYKVNINRVIENTRNV